MRIKMTIMAGLYIIFGLDDGRQGVEMRKGEGKGLRWDERMRDEPS